MLRLRFYTPGGEGPESIEPGPFFRLIGGMLCRGPDNEPVATYLERWRLMDAEFSRADALEAVVIYFESNAGLASSAYGPYEDFHVSEGVAWTGSRALARLDERTLLWYPPRTPDGWASVLIAPPGTSRFDLLGMRTGMGTGASARAVGPSASGADAGTRG
ncbi:MAG: hypothetical protein ACRETB_00270 [Steroidobacteraceae bacterium]